MTQSKQCLLFAIGAVLLAVNIGNGFAAKLDHLVPRGRGFRAGTHDTGVWGANLQNSLSPPRFAGRPSFGKAQLASGSSSFNRVVSPNSGYLPPREQQPSNQGYSYNPPPAPVNLYQPPSTTTTTTTTTTRRPPPPPPSGLYQAPVAPPSGLYETPVAPPSGLYETPVAQPSAPKIQKKPAPKKQSMFGMPYDFAYGVNDEDSGNHYSRSETHDGNAMRGQYKVLLPDGRTQVVTYFDDGNGFNAEVTYE